MRLACERHLRDIIDGPKRGLEWRWDKAEYAISFFEEVLKLTDGAFAGKPFILQPFQKFIVGSLFGWMGPDGYRRFRTAYIETGKGSGKALALNTPIPTPDGWTTMEALRVGDRVFDENGNVCVVLAVTETMYDRPCYRVGFSDGESIIADAEHLWLTSALRSGGRPGPKPSTEPRKGGYALRTTEQIAATVRVPASISVHPQAVYNHRVDVAGALQLPDVPLPIPPYTLGAWLGDGDSDCARLTMAYADSGIADAISDEGISIREQIPHGPNTARLLLGSGGRSQAARNGSLQASLRNLRLLGNKHIPSEYLRASEAQRLALLQGLLDTDGSIDSRSGQIEYCTTSMRLAADAVELIRSLGLKPRASESDAKLNGRIIGRRWRVTFHCDNSRRMFRLERKAERQRSRPPTRALSKGRMIVSCERIQSVPVKCISVDSRSHMYLAGTGMIPTHNSPLAAGIGLFGLTEDGEQGAEIYAAAVTRDQAKILFADAEKMGHGSEDLASELDFTVNNIAHPQSQSFFRAISAEARALDGKRVHMALIDEIHEHPNALVVDKMRAGTKNRRQGLIFEITNSGYDRNSVCYQHHVYSQQILEGIVDNDDWFAYVCQLDACGAEGHQNPVMGCPNCDDWTNEDVWVKVQPGLDTIMPRKYMREQVAEALGMPSKMNIVLRLNFCVWTEQAVRWLDMNSWDTCAGQVDPMKLRRRRCWLGIDLSTTRDMTAAALLFEPDEDDVVDVLMYYWVPQDEMRQRVARDRVPYDVWVREGYVEATEGNVVDYKALYERIDQFQEEGFNIEVIAMDPWNATAAAEELMDRGFKVEYVRQGYASLNEPCKELERRIMSGKIRHGGNPVLRWNASNVSVATDPAGNIKPDKATSTERIDGIAALVDAMSQLILGVDDTVAGYFSVQRSA